MSSPTAPRPVPRSRVATGVPWWVWVVLAIVTVIVGWSLLAKTVPVDPKALFEEGMKAAATGDVQTLERNIEVLRPLPEFAAQTSLLEAMMFIGRSRPLKAVPLLKVAAENPELKARALSLLGSCYASASDRKLALATLEESLTADPDADDARLNVVRLLSGCLAWEDALAQSQILVEREAKLPEVHQVRGDILFEMRRFADAAKEYEASIQANINDPSNGMKVTNLLRSLSSAGDYSRVEEFYEVADTPAVRDCVRAEQLVARGEIKEALTTLESIRRESPSDAWMNRIYGRAMLAYKSPEKAAEAVAVLRPMATTFTRDIPLYEVLAELAVAAGDDELAGLVNQNLEQMRAFDQQADAKLAEVVKTREDLDARLQLASLAANAGRFDLARKTWEALITYYPDREVEFTQNMMSMIVAPPPLVPIATSGATP